jgi:hypothetical protein
MLRLSDVYLVYAEAILGNNASTSDVDALQYFNAVRERANLDPVASFDLDDVYNERALEFAMEGQLWYDFVRMHYFDPEKVYDILSDQERGFFRITPDKVPNPTSWTIVMAPKEGGGVETRKYTVTSANFAIPLPAIELQRAPNLRKEPVPYQFD